MPRPTIYTTQLAEKICTEIASSAKSMKTICKELNVPLPTVLAWLSPGNTRHIAVFEQMYIRAKELQADFLAEEMLEIADDATNDYMTMVKGDTTYQAENKENINRSKLRLDTRKWIAAKLKPKKYGDRLELDGRVAHDAPLSPEVAAAIANKLNLDASHLPG